MGVDLEFSRFAKEYSSYNIIQNEVAKRVIQNLSAQPQRILDLGCGNGALCRLLDWEYEYFLGVDFAPKMLELHPLEPHVIETIEGDFNDASFLERLLEAHFDAVFSASALQWADDMEMIFQKLSSFKGQLSLAIFSANTFQTLHKTASLPPLLRSKEVIESLSKRYLKAKVESQNYSLAFESKEALFRYIKRSGVSGARRALSYKETKRVMHEYPHTTLEFEVVYIYT